MKILETIDRLSRKAGLQFLMIGGHAVSAHGYPRQTSDLDLLARKGERAAWHELLRSLDYTVFHEHETFSQFKASVSSQWPVDVMWANERTFAGMMAEATVIDAGKVRVCIPSVEHLLALKIHAVKFGAGHRRFKDILDIVYLVEANQIEVRGEKFKKLCEKYGDERVYASILVVAEGQ